MGSAIIHRFPLCTVTTRKQNPIPPKQNNWYIQLHGKLNRFQEHKFSIDYCFKMECTVLTLFWIFMFWVIPKFSCSYGRFSKSKIYSMQKDKLSIEHVNKQRHVMICSFSFHLEIIALAYNKKHREFSRNPCRHFI